MTQKHHIYAVLKNYHAGKLSKQQAMQELDLESVQELLGLLEEHKLLATEGDHYQSAAAPRLEEFFHDD